MSKQTNESSIDSLEFLNSHFKSTLKQYKKIDMPIDMQLQIKILSSHYAKYNRDFRVLFCFLLPVAAVIMLWVCLSMLALTHWHLHGNFEWFHVTFNLNILFTTFKITLSLILLFVIFKCSLKFGDWYEKINQKHYETSRNQYDSELESLLHQFGVVAYEQHSNKSNRRALDKYLFEMTKFQEELHENTITAQNRQSENWKWRWTLLVAVLVPPFASNFGYFKDKIKQHINLLLLLTITLLGFITVYFISIKPLVLEYTLEQKTRTLIPVLYRFRKSLSKRLDNKHDC